jgi:hypothetical protein
VATGHRSWTSANPPGGGDVRPPPGVPGGQPAPFRRPSAVLSESPSGTPTPRARVRGRGPVSG